MLKESTVLLREKIFETICKFDLEILLDISIDLKYKIIPSRLQPIYNNKFSYFGWWELNDYNNEWFSRFLIAKLFEYKEFNIRFYSLFQNYNLIKDDCKNYNGKKIFYSGENITAYIAHKDIKINNFRSLYMKNREIRLYSDYLINDVDLSMGYDYINNNKYLRFPLWILQGNLFPAESKYSDIKKIVDNINSSRSSGLEDCISINSHDAFGLRTKIANDLNGTFNITYAGKWRNNTADLWKKYENDKLKYMNLFKFNICPENMDAPHYCTEKIFDSFRAGCIPIYAGALNNPEPDVINKNAVIFWDLDGDNMENIKLIKRLNSDEAYYNKFIQQKKLLPYAAEYVYDRFNKLEDKMKELLEY